MGSKVDNHRQQAILSEMAGYDWAGACKRVDDRNSHIAHPAESIAVAVQQIPEHPEFIPNLLIATASQETMESVERDLQSDVPELSIAELFSGEYDA